MSTGEAIILAIIEGLTEFLPISSTGHLILASAILRIPNSDFLKSYEIVIQFGAILSVLVLYYRRFLVGPAIYAKLFVAFLPTGVVGFLAHKTIKTYLFHPTVVSVALILGGILLILFDRWTEQRGGRIPSIEEISYKSAFSIGVAQCISMIPGVSRAAATILGGIGVGFDRRQAAEFSFLLAIPTMAAATGYDLYKSSDLLVNARFDLIAIGLAISFVSALAAVKGFIAFVTRYGFKHFGYYRIGLGILFLLYAAYANL